MWGAGPLLRAVGIFGGFSEHLGEAGGDRLPDTRQLQCLEGCGGLREQVFVSES